MRLDVSDVAVRALRERLRDEGYGNLHDSAVRRFLIHVIETYCTEGRRLTVVDFDRWMAGGAGRS